ncbi:MAG: Uma2 family endonuclease [Bacteroidia bacterium]|nr:Uma2 family endonuclease [Bacteroidia bacterium]
MIPIPAKYLNLSEAAFFEFCREMSPYRIERDEEGKIYIQEPAGTYTGGFNAEVTTEISIWNRENNQGKVFDSSTGYTLPDGSVRSPDSSWIAKARWDNVAQEDRVRFAHISPDFVIEIKSYSDRLPELQRKMERYIHNGVRLAWLLDPEQQQAWIYRQDGSVEHRNSFDEPLYGEDVLRGFELRLAEMKD